MKTQFSFMSQNVTLIFYSGYFCRYRYTQTWLLGVKSNLETILKNTRQPLRILLDCQIQQNPKDVL